MKNIFKISLFTLGIVLSSNAFAATGTGEAQAELTNPLTVVDEQSINFGTIAIDPAAGSQTISIAAVSSVVTCPATYICSGATAYGKIRVTAAPNTMFSFSVAGATATLDDGAGNKLTFDPIFFQDIEGGNTNSAGAGSVILHMGGSIDFTGNEVAGTYSSANTGGSGYQITVNY